MRVAAWVIFGLSWLSSRTLVSAADLKLGADVSLVFASAEAGREILTRRDDFVRRLSPFDRAARLHSDQPVSEEVFLAHVAGSVQDSVEP